MLDSIDSRELSEWQAYFKIIQDEQKGKSGNENQDVKMSILNAFGQKGIIRR